MELEKICAKKVKVMRKCVLNTQEFYCRQNCNGLDKTCKDYIPMDIELDNSEPKINYFVNIENVSKHTK